MTGRKAESALDRIMAEIDRDIARDKRRAAARKGFKTKSDWLEMTGLHSGPSGRFPVKGSEK